MNSKWLGSRPVILTKMVQAFSMKLVGLHDWSEIPSQAQDFKLKYPIQGPLPIQRDQGLWSTNEE